MIVVLLSRESSKFLSLPSCPLGRSLPDHILDPKLCVEKLDIKMLSTTTYAHAASQPNQNITSPTISTAPAGGIITHYLHNMNGNLLAPERRSLFLDWARPVWICLFVFLLSPLHILHRLCAPCLGFGWLSRWSNLWHILWLHRVDVSLCLKLRLTADFPGTCHRSSEYDL